VARGRRAGDPAEVNPENRNIRDPAFSGADALWAIRAGGDLRVWTRSLERLASTDHLASWRAKLGAHDWRSASTIDIAEPARDIERAAEIFARSEGAT